MKLFSDQRRLYSLAAALLILTVALCVTWGMWQRPAGVDATATPPVTPSEPLQTPLTLTSPSPAASDVDADEIEPSPTATEGAQNQVSTVVYYQDNNGYLVPVMKNIPNQPGIAKATLSMMVQSPANDMDAARLGLRTILPEGTKIDLDITDKVARIDLSGEVAKLPDAQSELNMVSAVVQTLTEFPTVDTVRFLVDGKKTDKLAHGTSVAGDFTRGYLNLESASNGLTPDVAKTVMLYFPGDATSLIVPVTRMVYGKADINTAVMELAKGPSSISPLDGVLPTGTGLLGVENDGGKVTVNFTKEFINLAENTDGGRQALRALVLTCSQFDGVKSVAVNVEGEPYDTGAHTLSIPTFVNEANMVVEQFLQTQSAAIFELD